MTKLQAIDYQVMWNRLMALVEEQGQTLIRTAFSPMVRECGDISAGIFDLQGRMLAQPVTGTPGHINTMAAAVAIMLETFPAAAMRPGDVYVTNDPWAASGHLNDFLLVQPAFLDGRLVGLSACTSHLVDLGGSGMGPEGHDIFDEGLMVPPCKLVEGGEINRLLMDILRVNSREPIQNEGDIYALLACCEAGCQRLVEMMREFAIDDLDGLAEYIIETSHRGAVAAIAEVPNGCYRHATRIDGYDFELDLVASLTVRDDKMILDFTGSSGASAKGINCPLNYAAAYAVFAIRCLIGGDIPNNAGSLAPFKVTAPPGCIVNAVHPAPVAMRHTVGQMLPDLVFGCLRQALPDRVPAEGASCLYDLPMRSVANPDPAATPFAIELSHNGGTGARPAKDGLSATAYPSGVWGSQVEMTESAVPVLVRRRELRPDSAGAGRYRGGLGQVIEIESAEHQPFLLFMSVERVLNPAQGADGGGTGAAGHISFASGPVLPSKGEFTLAPGDRLIFQTPGGGGYGAPLTRNADAVAADVRRGLVSPAAARDLYGVVVDATGTVDRTATTARRSGK